MRFIFGKKGKKKKKKLHCVKGVDPAVERSSACELGRMQNIICYLASNTEVNAKLYLILHTDAERPAQLLGYESKTSININSIAIRASLSAGGSVISGLAFISTAQLPIIDHINCSGSVQPLFRSMLWTCSLSSIVLPPTACTIMYKG